MSISNIDFFFFFFGFDDDVNLVTRLRFDDSILGSNKKKKNKARLVRIEWLESSDLTMIVVVVVG